MHDIPAIIDAARREMPPLFALTELDRLTGRALRARTISNIRSKAKHAAGEEPTIPANIFLRQGRKILVHRDRLLAWWQTQLAPAD